MKYFRLAVLVVCVLLAVFALVQFAAALHQGALLRPASLTGNPNNLAIAMVGALLVAVRGRHVALSILFGVVLLLTQSLTGYLAAAAALFLVETDGPTKLWEVAIFLPLMVVIDVVGITSMVRAVDSLEYRLELWGLAWSQFVAQPLFGVGARALGDYLAAHDSVAPLPIHAHNLYLQVLAAWGLFGAIVASVVAFVAALIVFPEREGYARAFLVAVLVGGLGDYIFWFWPMVVLIPVLFGALLIPVVELELGADPGRPAARSRIPLHLPQARAKLVAEDPEGDKAAAK